MTPRHKKFLILILGLAFGLRLALSINHSFTFDDSKDYDTLARNLLTTHTYQVKTLLSSRMPGYPLFVAAIYAITNYSQLAVLAVQSLLGTLTVLIVHRLASRISPTAACIAALFAALDPLSIGFTASLLSEIPFTFTLLLALWLAFTIAESSRPAFRLWILLGLISAAAVYLRPSFLLLVPLIGFFLVLVAPTGQMVRSLIGALLAILLVLLSLLPWQFRNYNLFHSHFSRLTTLEGISLYEAVYPEADGSPKQDQIQLPPEMRNLNEAQVNDEWSRRAWHEIVTDPVRILKLGFVKAARTWSPEFNAAEYQNKHLQDAMMLWYLPIFMLALIGAFSRIMPNKIKMLLLIPILYFTFVHSLFLGSIRYRAPLMPVVCVLAASGLANRFPRLQNPKPPASEAV